ncbi:MAG TPA: nucleotidyltransferase substrate binding protein [Treponemataceae bacterium]|nr:nucleotidyltransferase substrate binding protein [Treponemataceae bacterium]
MDDVRWKQRFSNYSRAFALLREILDSADDIRAFEPIVKEGIIHRFEYTFELAWKTLKDKMLEDGIVVDLLSPKYVFKTAYQSKYINSIEAWLRMANDRNLMSHTYDIARFDEVLVRLKTEYYPLLDELYGFLLEAHDE